MSDEKQLTLAESAALERQQPDMLSMIERLIRDPSVDPDRIAQFMQLQERAERREAEKVFSEAMRVAQSEMAPIWKNRKNPSTNSTFADLEAVDAIARPIYTKHGFALSFNSKPADKGYATVCCTVLHVGGFSKDYELTGELDTAGPKGGATKTGIQGLGSSVSYLRRYLEAMIWNLVFTDDRDGNSIVSFVTQQQLDSLQDLIHEISLTPERVTKFLETMGAKSFAEIPRAAFPAAVNLLQAMRKRPS